jgi:hypothetical protein
MDASGDSAARAEAAAEVNIVRPQKGPQSRFLASRADIAFYGGAAGGGRTWALLLQPLRHRFEADFSAVFFRRTTVQVRTPGGLWDESFRLYPQADGEPFAAALEWRFPSGARVRFAHLEHSTTSGAGRGDWRRPRRWRVGPDAQRRTASLGSAPADAGALSSLRAQ